ncbi:MAG: oxidoreductase, coenzyme F420-dependent [Gammaproteobacteria bacterium]|nr:oxidoreductase, coenzyme F420-dependent [Gammaproteobacteria bacterium]
MKLGIIGAGNIGKSLGAWAAKVGYQVGFAARNISHAEQAAQLAGHHAKADSVIEIVKQFDLLLLAIPYSEVSKVIAEIKPFLKDKIVIDVTNPLTADYMGLALGYTTSAAEEIAKLMPEIPVVKAFNTVFAQIYAAQNPQLNGQTISVFMASDQPTAKAKVMELVSRLGFDAVDAGALKNARYLEPLAGLNIFLGYGQGLGTQIGFTLLR